MEREKREKKIEMVNFAKVRFKNNLHLYVRRSALVLWIHQLRRVAYRSSDHGDIV